MRRIRNILLRGHVWLAGMVAAPLIKWLPPQRVLRLMTPPTWWRPYKGVEAEHLRMLVDRRLAHPRLMAHRPCLRRGLVLFHMMRLAGLPARIHFGLYPRGNSAAAFKGHCWVTLDGYCIGEQPHASLMVVWTHGGEG